MGNSCTVSRSSLPQPQSRAKPKFRSVASRCQPQQVDVSPQLEGVIPGAQSTSVAVDRRHPSPSAGRLIANRSANDAAARRERFLDDIERQLHGTASAASDLDEMSELESGYESSDAEMSFTRNPFEPEISPRADAFGDECSSHCSPASPPLMQLNVIPSRSSNHTSKRSGGYSFSVSAGPGAESFPPALTLTESTGDCSHSFPESATRALNSQGVVVKASVNMELSATSQCSLSQSVDRPRSPRVVEFAGGPDTGTPHSLSRQSSASSILVKSSGSISLHRKPADVGLNTSRSSANRFQGGGSGSGVSPASPSLHPTLAVGNSQSLNLPSASPPSTASNSPMVVGEISLGNFAEF